jgi:hypothetical protein
MSAFFIITFVLQKQAKTSGLFTFKSKSKSYMKIHEIIWL